MGSNHVPGKQHIMVLLFTVQGERRYHDWEAWVHKCWKLPNVTYQVVSGPADHTENFRGSYDLWTQHLLSAYDVILIPYRKVGKVTGEVAINALVKGIPVYAVMYPEGLIEVECVRINNANDFKSGWEIVPKSVPS